MKQISFENLITLLNLILKINFIDSSIENDNDGLLITLKLTDSLFLRLDITESQSVFAYYEDKKMLRNGYGTLHDVASDILLIGREGNWVKN